MFKIIFFKFRFIVYFSIVVFSLFINYVWSEPLSTDYFLYQIRQPKTLDDAVKEIKGMISDGKSREEISKRVTVICDKRLLNNNDFERMQLIENWNPLNGLQKYSTTSKEEAAFLEWRGENDSGATRPYDVTAKWAWKNKIGQCNENSSLAYYILKHAGAEKVRLFENTKHAYVVWGMDPEANPKNKESWTNDVFIPDGWQGLTLIGLDAFNNHYCKGGGDVTHEKDRDAGKRCGEMTPTSFKVPACSYPPFCYGKGRFVHIDGWCHRCGVVGYPCCVNNSCVSNYECVNSICTKKKVNIETKTSNNVKSSQTNIPIKQEDETKVQERIPDANDKGASNCKENEERNDAGDCACQPGYEKVANDVCVAQCKKNEERNDAGDCVCQSGYEKVANDVCVAQCKKNEERNDAGDCVCQPGYEKVANDVCVAGCKEDEERNDAGDCVCQPGYEKDANDACVAECKENENRNDAGACECKPGYELGKNNNCLPICRENEVRNDSDKCVCLRGYQRVEGTCKKSGCSSDAECPQGYVCNSQSRQCLDPFDENYDSRNQLMAGNEQDRQRANDSQNIADANLNHDRGGFSSEGLQNDLDHTQDFVSAECSERKPCPVGYICEDRKCVEKDDDCINDTDCRQGFKCTDGKCIEHDHNHDETIDPKPPGDKPECSNSSQCSKGFICKNGHCVKKQHRFDCRKSKKCKKGYRCDKHTGKCIKKHRRFDCRKGDKCKRGYHCNRKNGKCKKINVGGNTGGGDGGHHHHNPPSHQPADGCAGGKCCKGHQLYCTPYSGGTTYSYPRTALDKNLDWICDICKRPFKTKRGRLAPGLRGARRGDVNCRTSH